MEHVFRIEFKGGSPFTLTAWLSDDAIVPIGKLKPDTVRAIGSKVLTDMMVQGATIIHKGHT